MLIIITNPSAVVPDMTKKRMWIRGKITQDPHTAARNGFLPVKSFETIQILEAAEVAHLSSPEASTFVHSHCVHISSLLVKTKMRVGASSCVEGRERGYLFRYAWKNCCFASAESLIGKTRTAKLFTPPGERGRKRGRFKWWWFGCHAQIQRYSARPNEACVFADSPGAEIFLETSP